MIPVAFCGPITPGAAAGGGAGHPEAGPGRRDGAPLPAAAAFQRGAEGSQGCLGRGAPMTGDLHLRPG